MFVFIAVLSASAFFSASEAAFLSLGRIGESRLTRSRIPMARLALYLQGKLNRLIFVVLSCNLIANVLATSLASTFFQSQLPWIQKKIIFFTSPLSDIVFIVVYTGIVLIFAEFFPKKLAIRFAFFFAIFSSLPLFIFYILFFPFIVLIERTGVVLRRFFFLKKETVNNRSIGIFGNRNKAISSEKDEPYSSLAFSHKEMLGYIQQGGQEGVLHLTESRLLESVVSCFAIPVKSLLIPREKMLGMEEKQLKKKNIVDQIRQFPYVNIPIYRGQKDNVFGVLSKRRFFNQYNQDTEKKFSREILSQWIVTPLILPETKNILDVLIDISHSSSEVALLADEFGGIEGMVTYEDVATRIFGKTQYGEEVSFIQNLGSGVFLVKGETSIIDFNDHFSSEIVCEPAETISGYLLEKIKKFPQKGERYSDGKFRYEIKEASQKRIDFILVRKSRKKL